MTGIDSAIIHHVSDLLDNAEAVLIGAGAGLTAAAGFNYMDEKKFAEVFSGWVKKGFKKQYELMGYPYLSQKEQWGYYKTHLTYVYFDQQWNELYQQLYNLIKDKNHFVMTSNVDGLFYKNGIDRQRFYSPQGDYSKIQCTKPCTQEVYDIKPFLDAMDDYFDHDEQVLTDDVAVPKCPGCGGPMFIHARVDGSFIDSVHEREREHLMSWLQSVETNRVFLLDLGSGFNTPIIVRIPMEQIAHAIKNATLVRVNLDHAEIPQHLCNKGITIKADIKDFITQLAQIQTS
jgi:NAD-dependent SIR2 family protein deacetylase